MLIKRFYTKYIRFFSDIILSFLAVWFFTDGILFSASAAVLLCLLYYAFRFYNLTSYSSPGAGKIIKALAKNLVIQVFVYGLFCIFRRYHDFLPVLYSGLLTLAIPFFSWFIFEFTGSRLMKTVEIRLKGAYPEFTDIFESIRNVCRGKIAIKQGSGGPGAEEHDGRIIFSLCGAALKKIPIDIAVRFKKQLSIKSGIWYLWLKRVADIVLSLIFLLILCIPLMIICLIIFLEDRQSPVFSQTRTGKNSKPFTLYKLRSMSNRDFRNDNPNSNIEQRLLKIGNFIRKTRLDETLQFINVLKGDMSIVGPRPEMEHYHKMASEKIPCYLYRLNVKPGITGWAQIHFIHTSSLEEYRDKTAYDLYYIKNLNPVIDVRILFKTIGTVIMFIGAR